VILVNKPLRGANVPSALSLVALPGGLFVPLQLPLSPMRVFAVGVEHAGIVAM
jgi:hypothetical protein